MVGSRLWLGSIRSAGVTVALLAVLASTSTLLVPSATAADGATQTRELLRTRQVTELAISATKHVGMPSFGGPAEGSDMPTAKQNSASSARYQGQADAYQKKKALDAAAARSRTPNTTATPLARTTAIARGATTYPGAQFNPIPYGSGGGGGGGGGGGYYDGGGGYGGMAAPAITPPSEEDYLAGDSGYQTQLSALQGALQRFLADSDFQRTNYTTDYNRSLRDLGYDEGTKAWNWNDKLTASGRGYQNQLDDFASRGMLQSQGYADAYSELQRMLAQQYDALSGAKTTFMNDMDRQIANFRGENTSNQQAARAEALQRRAAQYAL